MSNLRYELQNSPTAEVLDQLAKGIAHFNLNTWGPGALDDRGRFAIVAWDELGELVGGVYGDLRWDWLYIKMLWVALEWRSRGVGQHLLAMAEATAVQRGILHAHLETTGFQAIEFYQKAGYVEFGRLDGMPAGSYTLFLKKDLSSSASKT